jgi:hypothetical protein
MSRRPARFSRADIARALRAVVLSSYPDAFNDDALQGRERLDSTALADRARKRTEVLWISHAAAERVNVPGAAFRQAVENR